MLTRLPARISILWGDTRVRMAVSFLLILGGLNFLYYLEKKLALGIWDQPYPHFVALLSGYLCRIILPYSISVSGDIIGVDGRTSVIIQSGCNGLEALFLMAAGILSFPASWHQRLGGLARYLPLIFILNLFRVVLLVYIAHSHSAYLNVFHFQIAQGILIVFVLFFWIHYIRRADQRL